MPPASSRRCPASSGWSPKRRESYGPSSRSCASTGSQWAGRASAWPTGGHLPPARAGSRTRGLKAVVDSELVEQVKHVVLDRAGAHVETSADLGVLGAAPAGTLRRARVR